MTAISLQLSQEDVDRIAAAVTARLQPPEEKRWYTVADAVTYTGLSQEAIRCAAKRGKLPAEKGASGRLVFRRESLDSFMGGVE